MLRCATALAFANDESGPHHVVRIAFKPDGGQASEVTYADDNENGVSVDRYLGDTVSGRVYPDHYLPSDIKKWLTGRRATLRTYGEKLEILWLEPRKGTK